MQGFTVAGIVAWALTVGHTNELAFGLAGTVGNKAGAADVANDVDVDVDVDIDVDEDDDEADVFDVGNDSFVAFVAVVFAIVDVADVYD